MSEFHLVIGNRNYSSWSLRPWMLMTQLGVQFRETILPLGTAEFKDQVTRYSPTGRVPVLQHGEVTVWDSLSICEYIAEVTGRGWPASREARAVARSIAAEMHSSFAYLRAEWPMNARARGRRVPMTAGLKADVERIEKIWSSCRSRVGGDAGPWLFGEYSVADAMYAPVVLRFNTYGTSLGEATRAYIATALEAPPLRKWLLAAEDEPWTLPAIEVGLVT
jgi:glutathione S-transferase